MIQPRAKVQLSPEAIERMVDPVHNRAIGVALWRDGQLVDVRWSDGHCDLYHEGFLEPVSAIEMAQRLR